MAKATTAHSVSEQLVAACAAADRQLTAAVAELDGIPDIDTNSPNLRERFTSAVNAARAILSLTVEVENLAGDR